VHRAAIVVAGAVLAACGGGGEGSEDTDPSTAPTATVSAAPPTTLVAPPVVTDPPVTESPVTEPPGTQPPATEPPPTTLDPAALDAQIRADFERTMNLYYECVYEPETCAFDDINAEGSPIAVVLRDAVDELVKNGFRGRRDSGPLSFTVNQVTIVDSETALVDACVVDGAVLYEVGNPDDPVDDIVVNDSLTAADTTWTFVRIGERWLRYEVQQNSVRPDSLSCDE
jgi:hypothetical protein